MRLPVYRAKRFGSWLSALTKNNARKEAIRKKINSDPTIRALGIQANLSHEEDLLTTANKILNTLEQGHMLVSKGKVLPRGTKVLKSQRKKFPNEKFRDITYLKDEKLRKALKRSASSLADYTQNPLQYGFFKEKGAPNEIQFATNFNWFVSVDLKSAFNQISLVDAYQLLLRCGLKDKTAKIMAALIIDKETGMAYQGSPLTPVIFNMWIIPFLCDINQALTGKIDGNPKVAQAFAYADDIMIGFNQRPDNKIFDQIGKWAKRYEITFNPAKTHRFNIKEGHIVLGQQISSKPRVKSFKNWKAKLRLELIKILKESKILSKSQDNSFELKLDIQKRIQRIKGTLNWLNEPYRASCQPVHPTPQQKKLGKIKSNDAVIAQARNFFRGNMKLSLLFINSSELVILNYIIAHLDEIESIILKKNI